MYSSSYIQVYVFKFMYLSLCILWANDLLVREGEESDIVVCGGFVHSAFVDIVRVGVDRALHQSHVELCNF